MSAPAPKRSGFPRTPVTVLIIALIFALAAPSLGFVALLLFQSDNITRRQMEARAQQGLSAISQTLDRELRSMVTNLSVFASSGWIESEEYSRLHAKATAALAGADTFLIAVDGQMRQILNTRVPWGTPLSTTSDPASVQEAVARGEPWVSNIFFGKTAQRDVFNVVMPLISGEPRVAALILTRNADKLGDIFRDDLPPPGWSFAIMDREGKLAAGAPPVAGPADLLSQLCAPNTRRLHGQRVDGVEYSAAAETVDPWGWRACVWTSSEQADASISQRWRNFTILTLVVVFVTILSGAALGRMLAGAIRRAATVGRALDAGGAVPEQHSIVREVDEVLGTLTRAARRRLQHEQEQTVLLRETAHRAKNQLAIATALARLSARSAQSIEQLRDDIVARLIALGRSIDTISANPSGVVVLRDLIVTQLEPFAAGHPNRLDLEGPFLQVAPATAQSLGLVLHEMGTNAAKYGSWSAPEGRVRVDWARTEAGGLTIEWSELGGPPPKPVDRTGFGSSLIEMMIEKSLGGAIERDYRPSGLVVTFRLKPEDPLA